MNSPIGSQSANNSISTIEATPDNHGNGQTAVTTAGTAVQLANNPCLSVTIKAKSTNTGLIYSGISSVSSSNGFILSAGESATYTISNTNKLYINSSVNGEGVSYFWINT